MASQNTATESPTGHVAPRRSSPAGWVAATVMLVVFVTACLFVSRYDPPMFSPTAATSPTGGEVGAVSVVPMHFTFAERGDLDGRRAPNGEQWVVHSGAFSSDGEVLSGAPASVATLDTGAAPGQVVAELPADGSRSAAVVANADVTGSRFVAAAVSSTGDAVRLLLVDGDAAVDLAEVGVDAPSTLGLRFTGLSWVVTVDGGEVISHPVTSAELEALGVNTRFGLYAPPPPAPSPATPVDPSRFVALELR